MKLFGYLDDFLNFWFKWQSGLPLKYGIPMLFMEFLLLGFIISRFRKSY